MKSAVAPAEQRVVLENVSWSTFVALLGDIDDRHGRMAFDQGVLEIMSPSILHENAKSLLGRLLEVATEELGIDILSAGSLTMKREDLQRAIEPDECYYVANAAAVRGLEEVDLAVHPPPDLAIEVDISRSSMIKLGIYAALGVREFWRYDGEALTVRVLEAGGSYLIVDRSAVLPDLPLADLVELLNRRAETSETQLVRDFRQRVRERTGGADDRAK